MRTVPILPVRPLDQEDLEPLAELSSRLGAERPADWSGRLGQTGTAVVGVELDGKLVAYAAGEVRRSFGRSTPGAWVDAFGVDLAYRGRGIGRSLLAALLSRLRELTMTPFFRELGFREEPLLPLGKDL